MKRHAEEKEQKAGTRHARSHNMCSVKRREDQERRWHVTDDARYRCVQCFSEVGWHTPLCSRPCCCLQQRRSMPTIHASTQRHVCLTISFLPGPPPLRRLPTFSCPQSLSHESSLSCPFSFAQQCFQGKESLKYVGHGCLSVLR